MKKAEWKEQFYFPPSEVTFPLKFPHCKPLDPLTFIKIFPLRKGLKALVEYRPTKISIWRKSPEYQPKRKESK